jgi:hypothetical protein
VPKKRHSERNLNRSTNALTLAGANDNLLREKESASVSGERLEVGRTAVNTGGKCMDVRQKQDVY